MHALSIMDEVVIDVDVTCPHCKTVFKPTPDLITNYDERKRMFLACPECRKSFPIPAKLREDLLKEIEAKGIKVPIIEEVEKGSHAHKKTQDHQGESGSAEEYEDDEDVVKIVYKGQEWLPEDLIMTYGIEGLYILMEDELKRALKELPVSLSERTVDYILRQFRMFDHYKQYPQLLANLIYNVTSRKLSPIMIQEIVSRVFDVPRRYANIIQLAIQTNPELFYTMMPSNFIQQQPNQFPIMMNQQPLNLGQPTMGQPANPTNQVFDLRSFLTQLSTPTPMMTQTQTRPKEDGSKYITKEELYETLEEFFKKIKKEEEEKEKERMLYEAINKLFDRIERLEDEILKKNLDEEEEEEEEGKSDWIINALLSQIQMLQRQISKIEENLKEGEKKSALEELVEAAQKIKQLEEIFGVKKEEKVPPEILNTISELKSTVERLTGEIKPENLRLQELTIQKEIKELEVEGLKHLANRIASAIEKAPSVAAMAFGKALAGAGEERSFKNIVVVGDKVKAICPKCGAQFEKPIKSDKIDCPICGFVLLKKEGS